MNAAQAEEALLAVDSARSIASDAILNYGRAVDAARKAMARADVLAKAAFKRIGSLEARLKKAETSRPRPVLLDAASRDFLMSDAVAGRHRRRMASLRLLAGRNLPLKRDRKWARLDEKDFAFDCTSQCAGHRPILWGEACSRCLAIGKARDAIMEFRADRLIPLALLATRLRLQVNAYDRWQAGLKP